MCQKQELDKNEARNKEHQTYPKGNDNKESILQKVQPSQLS